jgi:glycosyltransferase involved in cell wall biosynthesis
MRLALLTTDNREYFHDFENPTPYFGTAPAALLQGFAELDKIDIHIISCAQRSLRAPTKLGENIWFHSLHVPKVGWLRTGYQGCIRAVRVKLKEIQPDIVHGQGTERDCAISAVFSGFPNVVTIHGNMRRVAHVTKAPPFSYNWVMAQLEKITLPRAAGVICITSYTQDAVQGLARKTWRIPNAVDVRFFHIERREETIPMILCVADICLRKNQNALIRSLDAIAAKIRFEIVFLGTSNAGDSYNKEFFDLLRQRSWCRYDGFANREKLKTYLARARFLVLPSLEDNCPMAVLEAMAAGLPVAAANVGGVPDLVHDGETGVLFDPTNESTMATSIGRLLEDVDLANRVAATARKRALQDFQPCVVAQQHVEVYKEVLQTAR